jgi:hypothetical protein
MKLALSVGCVLVALALAQAQARADRSIFLHGTKIDGVTNQTFRACDVTIDSSGNVLITAKGYSIERKDIKSDSAASGTTLQQVKSEAAGGGAPSDPAHGSPPPAAEKPSKRYFLVSMQNRTGATQYDVDVLINGKFIRTIHSKEAQTVIEVTGWMVAGKNQVTMAARKSYGGGSRVSSSPADFFKVILGEGSENGGKVIIDLPLVEFKRTADELANPSGEYTVTAR